MKVVIVEDEAQMRRMLGNMLPSVSPGCELIGTACSGKEGLKLIRESDPDLVILDVRMPDLDGLSMLRILREEGRQFRAVILSAQAVFSYAQEAIRLGVDRYLLKPVEPEELKEVLIQAEKQIRAVKEEAAGYTPEKIFLSALAGEYQHSSGRSRYLEEHYGLHTEGLTGVLLVWLGRDYRTYADSVSRALQSLSCTGKLFSVCILKRKKRQLVLAALYQVENPGETTEYLRKTMAPMLAAMTGRKAVMSLAWCSGMAGFHDASVDAFDALEYSLTEGCEELILCGENDRKARSFKYPISLEVRARQAAAQKKDAEFHHCLQTFLAVCRTGKYQPEEIKSGCFRFFYAVCITAQECGRLNLTAADMARSARQIFSAVSWEQIREAFQLLEHVCREHSPETDREEESLLVLRACRMIQEYYSQGITLEEIAGMLGVSEEYLSSRLKQETGRTFTEMIRHARIEKIKELLISTNLKLIQIADEAGYKDAKYMSRIFKEEVGMLPLDYRKLYL